MLYNQVTSSWLGNDIVWIVATTGPNQLCNGRHSILPSFCFCLTSVLVYLNFLRIFSVTSMFVIIFYTFLDLDQCSWGLHSAGIWCHMTGWLVPDILKPPHCLETMRTNRPVIQCYDPEEWNLKEQFCFCRLFCLKIRQWMKGKWLQRHWWLIWVWRRKIW